MKRKLFTTALLLGALCLQLGVSAASSGQSTLHYNGKGELGYQVDYLRPGGAKPALASARTMSLTNTDTSESFAYCLDVEKPVVENHKYAIANVEDVNYPNKETAGKIRGILRSSYPFVTLERIASRSGLAVPTAKEAITAAQMAIWELTNGGTYTVNLHPDDGTIARTHALLGWYRKLPPAAPQDPVAYLETKSTLLPDGTLDIAYRPVTGGNISGVTMATPLLSDNVKFEKKAKDEQGFYHIWVASPPASFTATFRAAQDLILDTYFYAPVGGKTASQYLAGVRSGVAQLEKVETFSGTAVLDGGIRILKFDSGSSAPLAGVTFSVATDTAFSQNLRFCVTDSNGSATVDSLAPGTYYVREDKPLEGYIPAEGYSTITVTHDTVQLPIKNTRYSTLEIKKVDDKTSAPLAGAKFNIYKGVGTSGTLLFADVTVNALGIFTQEKLLPGTYTIVETTPPAGYQKDPTPQTITLVAGETATVRFV
ncbi:MAG: SpaA isopeptide-forming pilin-related protein, partial [Oscillospiraceae bacterium]